MEASGGRMGLGVSALGWALLFVDEEDCLRE